MKIHFTVATLAALTLAPAGAMAGSDKAVGQLDNSWGDLTKDAATEDGRAHGGHSSDPAGDGPGNDNRVGLANVTGNKGDMAATTSFIDSVVNP